ncbi:MAG TPA: Amuc_1100 family pilus-like protein [Candidatus Angelobacter sp.]|nr:Amuc_1100 family pilus-like protein [Candidatus Angelobacter sp.]
MSWVKRNLYFVISCVLAVVLLIAAGWYCYSSWQSNDANWQKLSQDYTTLQQLPPIDQTNLDMVRQQTKEVHQRVAQMQEWFPPIPAIPNTNQYSDQHMAFAVRQTVGELRAAAAEHNVMLQPEFDFSFSLQESKAVYDPNSWDQLAKQLGEVKAICDILFESRVSELDAVQRERTADDVNNIGGGGATQPDYIDSTSITNQYVVITPYQVTFQCFTPELGNVLSSFANQKHTFVVKTLNIEPEEAMAGGAMEPGVGQYGQYGQYGATMPTFPRGGPAITVIDEKKLKVVLQVDVVKKLPAAGR